MEVNNVKMIRNFDETDKALQNETANNPGITMSELLKYVKIPLSSLRYRLMTLEMAEIVMTKRSRNFVAYYINNLSEHEVIAPK